MAFTPGFTRSICVRWAPTTSRAESSLVRSKRASSHALRPQMLTTLERKARNARQKRSAQRASRPLRSRSATREILERGGDAAARERHARGRQAHLDAAQRAGQHQLVEVAEVADAKHLPFEPSKPGAERHVEAVEHDAAKRVRVVTGGHHHGGQRVAALAGYRA